MSVHADPPPPIVREPQKIQYATGPQLGKGGFAICHRAEICVDMRPTGKIVALKIVKSKMEPAKLAQKFVTELQLHSKLHHPNIVEFYRAFSFEASTYVVLELCENGSLADALRKRTYFSMPEIRRFLIQICGAVKYLHHRNIVHRDLKTGNLFLDKGMNIKVGDFGLAAVLVSKHDIGMRRTTMCGTPNYLAPEILEKGGRGHNEKVDLWAIGIIAYTLAVGKAPFHASKREEIYKKLQTCEYKWPEISKNHNDISTDLQDLVSSLLVHEDDRPCPDEIASHSFFKTQFIPDSLDSSCTTKKPHWPIRPPTGETLQRGFSESWAYLCKESGVGFFAPGKAFPLGGQKRIVSVVKDCEKEIHAGRAPVVPIPKDSVYLPFPERINLLEEVRAHNLSEIAEEKEYSAEGPQLTEVAANYQSKIPAQVAKSQYRKLKENVEPVQTAQDDPAPIKRKNSNRKKQEEAIAGASRQPSGERTHKQRAVSSRVTSREQPVPDEQPMLTRQPSRKEKPAVTVTRVVPSVRVRQVSTREKQPVLPRTQSAPVLEAPVRRARTVRAVSASDEPAVEKKAAVEIIEIPDNTPPIEVVEKPKPSTFSDPTIVLARAAKLRDNIASALSGKASVGRRPAVPSTQPNLPFVSKWVDYARKHGVGYVLEDGSIGCLFNASSRHPVTHVVVKHGYEHLQKVGKEMENLSAVPMEYYTQKASTDEVVRTDVGDDRKRTTGVLWAKFGRYMCQQLGQAEGTQNANGEGEQTLFVRYYQRLGTVGVWGFSDGSFQFNFPDHTKLVLSPDGKLCNFTTLPPEAFTHITKYSELPLKYIRRRQVLCAPVVNLLYGGKGFEKLVPVTEANLLRKKLMYVAEVVGQWVSGKGLGCRGPGEGRVIWDGEAVEETNLGKKEEWIAVGGVSGGERS